MSRWRLTLLPSAWLVLSREAQFVELLVQKAKRPCVHPTSLSLPHHELSTPDTLSSCEPEFDNRIQMSSVESPNNEGANSSLTSESRKMDGSGCSLSPTDRPGGIISLRKKSKSEQKLTTHSKAPPLNPVMRTCSNPNYGCPNVHLFNLSNLSNNMCFNSPVQSPEPYRRRLSEFSFSDRWIVGQTVCLSVLRAFNPEFEACL
jgi:hypothetical protein